MKHKIFGFLNGGSRDWLQAMALGDDGVVLGEHICSHEAWIPHDLGMDGRSNWKHENYDKHFGVGNWETEFVPRTEIANHEGLQAALKCARERVEKEENVFECARAGATVVLDEDGKETEIHVGAD